MSWLAYALIGMTIWSAAAIADRFFLLTIKSVRFYLVLPTLLQLPLMAALLLYFPLQRVDAQTFLISCASGVLEAAVLYFLYVAVKSDEVSRVFPLTGLGPIMTLVIGWLILHESLEPLQLAAMCLFLVGGVILALEPGKGSRIVISKALRPIVIGSLLTSLFTLTLRFAFVESDFWSGFFYSRLGFFVAGLVILYLFRGEITKQWMSLPRRWHVGLIANQTLAFSGHLFYFFSLSLASAALVQATLSAQSGIIFIMALAVSWWSPKLLEERVTRAALLQKFIGIGLVTVAAFLLAVM